MLKKLNDVDLLSDRINALGKKASQLLLFLSFAMVSVATLEAVKGERIAALTDALRWRKFALLPILVSIVPMKEASWASVRWYQCIHLLRFWLLVVAVILILIGVGYFIADW
jgi:hypothetical protein